MLTPLDAIASRNFCESLACCFHTSMPAVAAEVTIEGKVLTLRHATAAEVIALRHEVHPRLGAFEQDDDRTTRHFGAFTTAGECVSCCTFLVSTPPAEKASLPMGGVLQLRGMSVDKSMARRRLGSTLLAFAEDVLRAENHSDSALKVVVWTNVYDRKEAFNFFEAQDWKMASKRHSPWPATAEVAEPHFVLYKEFGAK
ncbi:hypothetical protein T492DRAFT_875901 [Pavlovales sp. CCMP2436]|nr:hypothetical protein T492DRAFT_875901 [Pavlovales sp. CCMP2436]